EERTARATQVIPEQVGGTESCGGLRLEYAASVVIADGVVAATHIHQHRAPSGACRAGEQLQLIGRIGGVEDAERVGIRIAGDFEHDLVGADPGAANGPVGAGGMLAVVHVDTRAAGDETTAGTEVVVQTRVWAILSRRRDENGSALGLRTGGWRGWASRSESLSCEQACSGQSDEA